MTAQPDVSVILTTYNGTAYIRMAIDSLLRQTIGLDRMQVIVVDDGSTDGTAEIVDDTAALCPAFEVTHQPNSGGPAAPRNLALKSVRGRYLFFLDQDDYLSEDALERMVLMADENGTDVVIPRMKGLGGRNTPRVMFQRTIPRTDVFSCAAYWLLNPMKLYRMTLVRELGLHFGLDMPWAEDQPFVAPALLKANGISILADRDYVFWLYRSDRTNITTSQVSLSARMPVVDRMLDYLAANVPPGEQRDRLMRRHFQVEVLTSAFEGYRTEPDPVAREAAFARFRDLVDAYYTDRIDAEFPPQGRVLMRLLREDRPEEFAEYLELTKIAGKPAVLREEEHVYLEAPWFRDPARGMPDSLFDIAGSVKLECRVEPLAIQDSGLHVSAICRLGALSDGVTGVDMLARSRATGVALSVPLAHQVMFEEERTFIHVDDTIAADRFLPELPHGSYALYLRVTAGSTVRVRRVRECAPPPAEVRSLHSVVHRGLAKSGTLETNPDGFLMLRVVDVVSPWRRLVRRARRGLRRLTTHG